MVLDSEEEREDSIDLVNQFIDEFKDSSQGDRDPIELSRGVSFKDHLKLKLQRVNSLDSRKETRGELKLSDFPISHSLHQGSFKRKASINHHHLNANLLTDSFDPEKSLTTEASNQFQTSKGTLQKSLIRDEVEQAEQLVMVSSTISKLEEISNLVNQPETRALLSDTAPSAPPSYDFDKPLQKSRSSLRNAPVVTNISTASTVPTNGLSEREALNIERQVILPSLNLNRPANLNELLGTNDWFQSSTETSRIEDSPASQSLTTGPGLSVLQNQSTHNPFFREELTATVQNSPNNRGTNLSAYSHHASPRTLVNWDSLHSAVKPTQKPETVKQEWSGERERMKRKYVLIIASLSILLFIMMSQLIYLYVRGSHFTATRYLNRAPNFGKTTELLDLRSPANITVNNQTSSVENNSIVGTEASNIFQYNSFANINPKYKYNEKVKRIMLDQNLRNVFYGLNYAPANVIQPLCGANIDDVMLDIAVLSRVTTRIKLYGMQCDQLKLVLSSIQDLGVNLTVTLGIWINSNQNNNDYQLLQLKEVISHFPVNLIDRIVVGDEVLSRGDKTIQELENIVKEVQTVIRAHNSSISVGVSEFWNGGNHLSISEDTGLNLHPFFKGFNITNALDFISNFTNNLKRTDPLYLSEVGWPSEGGRIGNAVLSVGNLQRMVNEFLCEFNKRNIEYYWFELFDEPWKRVFDDGVRDWESHWGIFDKDRNLKIKLPICI